MSPKTTPQNQIIIRFSRGWGMSTTTLIIANHPLESADCEPTTRHVAAFASDWSRSARMSSMCSMPMLRRTRSGVMPPAA